ncbi:hypothetical protein BKP35_01205 [Anaerobacillus arseniciselenatis]|uniref:TVP38/TMEM64 family membrane protein n=1 Tax=Anaerobacillus arseniciselenatis TaxID=85682 RepID=A0A1S2LSZ4_9BACI|nr:VTT domain-containing protein [Anaerobacillus arseniciselenatis]OIJ15641.1 hypothetical protein BKP35_01205 [Anaerobacillus arseniciselenatis]
MIKGWVKIILFLTILLVTIYFLINSELFYTLRAGELDHLYNTVSDQLPLLLLVTFIVILIQNTLTIFPLILILTKNIAFFGFFYGVIWSWIFSVVAAAIVFVSIRYCFKDFLEKKVSVNIKEKAEKNGFMYVLFARVVPVAPTSIINMVSGVSSIKFKDFILATSIGNLIYFSVLSLVPLGIINGTFDQLMIFLIIAIAFVVSFIYMKYKKKKKSNALRFTQFL